MKIVVGITGSSGAVYALDFLKKCPGDKFLVVSAWGKVLLRDELAMGEKDLLPYVERSFSDDDLTAPMASGSNLYDAFVILPASTSTVGKIASGLGDTLITRTAQVCLKERRKLIICVRETSRTKSQEWRKLRSFSDAKATCRGRECQRRPCARPVTPRANPPENSKTLDIVVPIKSCLTEKFLAHMLDYVL